MTRANTDNTWCVIALLEPAIYLVVHLVVIEREEREMVRRILELVL